MGKRKIKGGACARSAFRPGATAMPLNNAPDIGQTDPDAFKLRDRVQPLEYPKELVCVLHVEPRAVIAYMDQPVRVLIRRANFDARFVALAGEFQSVADEIKKDLAKQCRIAFDRGQRIEQPFDLSAFGLEPKVAQH